MKIAVWLILLGTSVTVSAFSILTDVTSVKAAQKLSGLAKVFNCRVEYIAPDKLANRTSFGNVQVFAGDLREANLLFLNRAAVLVLAEGDLSLSGRVIGTSDVRPRLVDFDCAPAR